MKNLKIYKSELLNTEQKILEDIRYRTFLDVEDCLIEILLYRGDLTKVKQRYLPSNVIQSYKNRF